VIVLADDHRINVQFGRTGKLNLGFCCEKQPMTFFKVLEQANGSQCIQLEPEVRRAFLHFAFKVNFKGFIKQYRMTILVWNTIPLLALQFSREKRQEDNDRETASDQFSSNLYPQYTVSRTIIADQLKEEHL